MLKPVSAIGPPEETWLPLPPLDAFGSRAVSEFQPWPPLKHRKRSERELFFSFQTTQYNIDTLNVLCSVDVSLRVEHEAKHSSCWLWHMVKHVICLFRYVVLMCGGDPYRQTSSSTMTTCLLSFAGLFKKSTVANFYLPWMCQINPNHVKSLSLTIIELSTQHCSVNLKPSYSNQIISKDNSSRDYEYQQTSVWFSASSPLAPCPGINVHFSSAPCEP